METYTPCTEDLDFMIETRASQLRYSRKRLKALRRSRFPIADICLAFSTLTAGASFGALTSGLTTASSLWWIFYTIMPMIAVGTFVAYLYLGKESITHGDSIAEEVLAILPDPDNALPLHPEYAKLAGVWESESRTSNSGKSSRGELTVSVRGTTIIIAGILFGESDTKIAEILSRFASYDPSQKRLEFIYGYSAINDNGQLDNSECVYSGVVFEAPSDFCIRGNWCHLTGPSIAGMTTFRKKA
jgi:hypothetical protein